MKRQPAVLLVTHSQDRFTVDRVARALERSGARALRIDTDRFPAELELHTEVAKGRVRHGLRYRRKLIDADDVDAVWLRRLVAPKLEEVDRKLRPACVAESIAVLRGFLDGLRQARFVDPLARTQAAENKLRQLQLAGEIGLRVPRTLVTNEPKRVRELYRALKGQLVAKLLRPVTTSMGAPEAFVYTSLVDKKDLAELDSLRACPMVFQELIPKAWELRVAFVAGRCFVGRIDASRSAQGQIDWRRARPDECSWEPGEVPADVRRGLIRLMKRLGLIYGAIDLIRTPGGEHVLLEVNPGGEWGMLERELGLPISQALAAALLGARA